MSSRRLQDVFKTNKCLLGYNYFKNYYKVTVINLSKQKALDVDLKLMQQINFAGNLTWDLNTAIFLIIEEAKQNKLFLK